MKTEMVMTIPENALSGKIEVSVLYNPCIRLQQANAPYHCIWIYLDELEEIVTTVKAQKNM